jgi:hypothetical protein
MPLFGSALLLWTGLSAAAATMSPARDTPQDDDVPAIDWQSDYRAAYELAEAQRRQLLVWFRDAAQSETRSDLGELWNDLQIRRRMQRFVPVRVATGTIIVEMGSPMLLAAHPAFAELDERPGLAVIDLSDPRSPHYGYVVSIYPLDAASPISTAELTVLLDLPSGSLTQRTLIFAVRTHPESPRSASGEFLGLLAAEAESHSALQARRMLQGHHDWEQRFYRLNDQLPDRLVALEVCAESWPGQPLLRAARGCVDSWRRSPGHWNIVRQAHPVFGYDMKRGRNGIWYATGVFGHRD